MRSFTQHEIKLYVINPGSDFPIYLDIKRSDRYYLITHAGDCHIAKHAAIIEDILFRLYYD